MAEIFSSLNVTLLERKIEGHFMDGAMIDSLYDRGFYAAANPAGITPKTNMLVVRLGFHI